MHSTSLLRVLVLLVLLLFSSGCVTRGYKLADEKKTPPAVPLNLTSAPVRPETDSPAPTAREVAPTEVVVATVIVYQGPGSWKREAYWDEYVVEIKNRGDTPVIVADAVLQSNGGETIAAGDNPWRIERASKSWWQTNAVRETGTYFALGAGTVAGLSAAWAASWTAAWGGTVSTGAATAGAVGTVAFFALPVVAGGTVYMNIHRKHQVEAEFARRRLKLPLTVPAGQSAQGSLFFRLTPSPRELMLRTERVNTKADVTVSLEPLNGLHVNAKTPSAPPPTAASPH